MLSKAKKSMDAIDEFDDCSIDVSSILGSDTEPKSVSSSRKSLRVPTTFLSKRPLSIDNKIDKSNIPTPFDDILLMPDNSIKKTGLNYKQRKAIRYLTVFNYSIEDTAAACNVTATTVHQWMTKSEFARLLFEQEQFLSIDAMEYRRKNNNEIIDAIYEELYGRIHRGDLNGLSFKELVDTLQKFSSESRLDDKNAVTQRTETNVNVDIDFNNLRERFNLHRVRRQLYDSKVGNRSLPVHEAMPVTIEGKIEDGRTVAAPKNNTKESL